MMKNYYLHIIQSRMMSFCLSVHLSVRLRLKILVTTEPIGFHYSGNIPAGPEDNNCLFTKLAFNNKVICTVENYFPVSLQNRLLSG